MENKETVQVDAQQEQPVKKEKKFGVLKFAGLVLACAGLGYYVGKRGVKGVKEDISTGTSKVVSLGKKIIPGKKHEVSCESAEVAPQEMVAQPQQRENGNGRRNDRPRYEQRMERRPQYVN